MKDVDRIAMMKNGLVIYQGGYRELTESGIFADYLDINQISARALIGQSAMVYCAGKPMETSCVLPIIIQQQ